jgi:hypothetical protein
VRHGVGVDVVADDVAGPVDTPADRAWVDWLPGKSSVLNEPFDRLVKPCVLPLPSTNSPTTWVWRSSPWAMVEVAPGTSNVVKLPLELRRNPWIPVPSWNHPEMSPALLIPWAAVRDAPGTSNDVKVNAAAPDARARTRRAKAPGMSGRRSALRTGRANSAIGSSSLASLDWRVR